jgi:hypothetical protein
MTDDDLAAIEARLGVAPTGRWRCDAANPGGDPYIRHGDGRCLAAVFGDQGSTATERLALALAIVAARNDDVPALLAEVRFLRGLLADMQEDGRDVRAVEQMRRALAGVVAAYEEYRRPLPEGALAIRSGEPIDRMGRLAREALAPQEARP